MFRARPAVLPFLLALVLLTANFGRAEARIDEALADQLLDMVEKSEKVHKPLLTNPRDEKQIRKAVAQEQENMVKFREIVKKYGWPGKNLVGEEGAKAAFQLVAQSNADKDFQRQCIKLMEDAAKKGDQDWKDVAFLTDLLLVLDGKKQRYGTQIDIPKSQKKGAVILFPIEDEKNVDKRRSDIDLPPITDFKKQLEGQLQLKKDK